MQVLAKARAWLAGVYGVRMRIEDEVKQKMSQRYEEDKLMVTMKREM